MSITTARGDLLDVELLIQNSNKKVKVGDDKSTVEKTNIFEPVQQILVRGYTPSANDVAIPEIKIESTKEVLKNSSQVEEFSLSDFTSVKIDTPTYTKKLREQMGENFSGREVAEKVALQQILNDMPLQHPNAEMASADLETKKVKKKNIKTGDGDDISDIED